MGHNSPVRNVVLHDQPRTAFSIQVQPQRRSSRPDNIDLSFPPIYHNQPRSFQNSTFFQNKRQQQHPPPPPPPPTPQYQNHVYQGFTNQDILGPFVQSMPNNKLGQGQAQGIFSAYRQWRSACWVYPSPEIRKIKIFRNDPSLCLCLKFLKKK